MNYIVQTNKINKIINNQTRNISSSVLLNKSEEVFTPVSFGVVIRVKDGVAFARDLGFANFGELAVFIPSPSRLSKLRSTKNIKYVDGMIVGVEDKLTSIVIFGNERLVKVGDRIITKGGIVSVMVGIGLLGRILDPLGNAIDDPSKSSVSGLFSRFEVKYLKKK